jgi:hypothetical protein
MANEPKRQEPEIMPPRPNVEPQRTPPEIPQDKDTPESNTPVRATSTNATRSVAGANWWC